VYVHTERLHMLFYILYYFFRSVCRFTFYFLMRDLIMRLSTPRIVRINKYLALISDLTVYLKKKNHYIFTFIVVLFRNSKLVRNVRRQIEQRQNRA
jgi:hypothetical protein